MSGCTETNIRIACDAWARLAVETRAASSSPHALPRVRGHGPGDLARLLAALSGRDDARVGSFARGDALQTGPRSPATPSPNRPRPGSAVGPSGPPLCAAPTAERMG